jgi:hypothetical protein
MPVILLLTALVMVAVAGRVEAGCRPVLDCTIRPCQQFEECDSALDQSGARLRIPPPGRVPRPVAPGALIPERLPLLPPRDTALCRHAYVCDGGHCGWQVICQ